MTDKKPQSARPGNDGDGLVIHSAYSLSMGLTACWVFFTSVTSKLVQHPGFVKYLFWREAVALSARRERKTSGGIAKALKNSRNESSEQPGKRRCGQKTAIDHSSCFLISVPPQQCPRHPNPAWIKHQPLCAQRAHRRRAAKRRTKGLQHAARIANESIRMDG